MTLKYFYDTEFIDNGKTIDLVSIGICDLYGREYYAINQEFSHTAFLANPWLVENVLPSLPYVRGNVFEKTTLTVDVDHADFKAIKPKWRIAEEVREFLQHDNPGHDWRRVELWAYYGAYDHVALAQLWGAMADLPPGIPMYTNDIMQASARAAGERLHHYALPEQTRGIHHALADAWHVREMWKHLPC